MKKSSSKQAVSRNTAISVLVVLAFLIGSLFLLVQQANFLVGRSLLIAFGNGADSTYKGAWYGLDGDLVAKDFVLKPDGPETDVTLTFKRVRVDTPGWLWVLKTLRSSKIVADTDRLHVTLEDGTSDGGVDPSLGDLGPFGTDTASPFEAEGCMRDTAWLRSELIDMGLSPGRTSLDFDYRVNGSTLDSQITLATPGVSKVTLVRHETLADRINPYLLDLTQTKTTDEHWLVQDEGFVKARNAYCAKHDGITDGEFVARHVASVQRLLAAQGLALDADTLAAYGGFARNGGEIGFGGSYVKPLPSEIYYDVRDSGVAFTRMHGIVEREGRKIVAQWSQIAPRPLAGLDELPTYAAMVKEQGGSAPAADGATMVSTAGDVAPATAAVPTSAGSAPVAALPAPVPVAALVAPGDEIDWKDLSRYIGRDVEIRTAHSSTRLVTILEANINEIRVEGSVLGGHVENRIYKDGFLRAILVR